MFIHLSLHERKAKVLGMPSPEMKNEFTLCFQIINSLESVGMEGCDSLVFAPSYLPDFHLELF